MNIPTPVIVSAGVGAVAGAAASVLYATAVSVFGHLISLGGVMDVGQEFSWGTVSTDSRKIAKALVPAGGVLGVVVGVVISATR